MDVVITDREARQLRLWLGATNLLASPGCCPLNETELARARTAFRTAGEVIDLADELHKRAGDQRTDGLERVFDGNNREWVRSSHRPNDWVCIDTAVFKPLDWDELLVQHGPCTDTPRLGGEIPVRARTFVGGTGRPSRT